MSHSWDCPSTYEARRRGERDYENRGYASHRTPYDDDCREARDAYIRGQRNAEYDAHRAEDERREREAAQRRAADQRAMEEQWQHEQWERDEEMEREYEAAIEAEYAAAMDAEMNAGEGI